MSVIIPIIENSPLFKLTSHDPKKCETVYSLRAEKLSKDHCHIFYCDENLRNILITTMLEFYTFHPLSKLSEKFQIDHLRFKGSAISMCSFPKEFAIVCERAAKTFDMQIVRGKAQVTDVWKRVASSGAPALTLAADYKKRQIFEEFERPKSVAKDALAIPVKKQLCKNIYCFPKADNILWVKGKKMTKEELVHYQADIYFWGNYFQKAGVD